MECEEVATRDGSALVRWMGLAWWNVYGRGVYCVDVTLQMWHGVVWRGELLGTWHSVIS